MLKDRFKKKKEYHFSDFDFDTQEEDHKGWFGDHLRSEDEDFLAILDRQFTYEKILDTLHKLDRGYAEVLHFKYVESKSNEEIAILCDISLENVRQRISRWCKKIKQLLSWE